MTTIHKVTFRGDSGRVLGHVVAEHGRYGWVPPRCQHPVDLDGHATPGLAVAVSGALHGYKSIRVDRLGVCIGRLGFGCFAWAVMEPEGWMCAQRGTLAEAVDFLIETDNARQAAARRGLEIARRVWG